MFARGKLGGVRSVHPIRLWVSNDQDPKRQGFYRCPFPLLVRVAPVRPRCRDLL